jgi:predicted Zn finger-like uncharacterized protein
MLLIFTCEHCGKRFKVDERSRGKRGRCSHCGQVMMIPRVEASEHAHTGPVAAAKSEAEPAFRLSPPEPRPLTRELSPPPEAVPPVHHHGVVPHQSAFQLEPHGRASHAPEPHDDHVHFELLDDDADLDAVAQVSPAVKRGLQEIAEFERDPRGYNLDGERSGVFSLLGMRDLGPASWLYTKWRGGVNQVLKVFRWIDTWAYLISVPFLILMIFGIVVENRQFVHTGAVVVVLSNYGRFWADLLAFFVRPYKDGPLHGLLFLFPPYTIYYVVTRWDSMKKIVRRIATSCVPIFLVILIYGFLPSVNPESKDVQGFGAKFEAGRHQLDKDIESELESLEKELIGGGKSEKAASAPPEGAASRPKADGDSTPRENAASRPPF